MAGLKSFAFVGLMERFEESMLLLKLSFPAELRHFTRYLRARGSEENTEGPAVFISPTLPLSPHLLLPNEPCLSPLSLAHSYTTSPHPVSDTQRAQLSSISPGGREHATRPQLKRVSQLPASSLMNSR